MFVRVAVPWVYCGSDRPRARVLPRDLTCLRHILLRILASQLPMTQANPLTEGVSTPVKLCALLLLVGTSLA